MKDGGKNGTLCNELLTNILFYLTRHVEFVDAPILFRPECFMVKRYINGFWHYFSCGVNVE